MSLVPQRNVVRTPSRVTWQDAHIRVLIAERKRRNFDYHYAYPGRNRRQYWQEIANTVNSTCGTRYSGKQCENKFNSLVNDYNISKLIIHKNVYKIYILYINILILLGPS